MLIWNKLLRGELFKTLKDKSSSVPLTIPNRFIKLLATPLSPVMVHISNYSMNFGYAPKAFKTGKQTPVCKDGEVSVKKIRPITMCNNISKIL